MGLTVFQETNNNKKNVKKLSISSFERFFENIKSGSYSQNSDFDNLRIEDKLRLLTLQIIDCLTDNKLEMLKVSLIK